MIPPPYDPFSASRRMALAPPCSASVARLLDGGGFFGRCDGCGWLGIATLVESEAMTDVKEHMEKAP